MILYDQNYEMIGISSEGLSLFGFLTPEDFFRRLVRYIMPKITT